MENEGRASLKTYVMTQVRHHIFIKTLTFLLILLRWDLQWGSLMLLFLSFFFSYFSFWFRSYTFFHKKLYHINNKKLTVPFLQLGVLGSHIVCLFVFVVFLNLICFSKNYFDHIPTVLSSFNGQPGICPFWVGNNPS